MPLVNILVNGHAYAIACDAGEEDHVRELGAFIDDRVGALTASAGQVGEARLLLMAGIVVADELKEALARLEERDKELAALKNESSAGRSAMNASADRVAESLESAAERIEAIAVRLSPP